MADEWSGTGWISPGQKFVEQLRDNKTLRAWLGTRSREECVAIAARAALRAMPSLATHFANGWNSTKQFGDVVLPVVRCMAAPWVSVRYPSYNAALRPVGFSATNAAVYAAHSVGIRTEFAVGAANYAADAAFTARAAVDAAFTPGAAADAVDAAASAFVSDTAASAAIYAATASDAAFIALGGVVAKLIAKPLWPQDEPRGSKQLWNEFKASLPADQHWDVWTRWWEARRDGGPAVEALEIFRVVGDPAMGEDFWKQEPKKVNWRIKEIEERLEREAPDPSIETQSKESNESPPKLPEPELGPNIIATDEKIDIDLHRQPGRAASKRSNVLLDELREAARDFEGAFDPSQNTHRQVRNLIDRYRRQIELDNPDVDVIFSLGLRLENAVAADAERQKLADSLDREPEFTTDQREALLSVRDLHAVFIATDPEGVELLTAAERYKYRASEDERFKKASEPVTEGLQHAHDLSQEQLNEFLQGALAQMGVGEAPAPARAGVIARGTVQRVLLFLAKYAIAPLAGAALVHTSYGQEIVQSSAPLAEKAIRFFLDNASSLRDLAAVAPDGFGFLNQVIEYIKHKVGRRE